MKIFGTLIKILAALLIIAWGLTTFIFGVCNGTPYYNPYYGVPQDDEYYEHFYNNEDYNDYEEHIISQSRAVNAKISEFADIVATMIKVAYISGGVVLTLVGVYLFGSAVYGIEFGKKKKNATDLVEKLAKCKELLDSGAITQAEFDSMKNKLKKKI